MPIFAFLIVQGYFHTKDLTKYVKRVFITGVITQVLLFVMYTLNKFIFIQYTPNEKLLNINIIISFAISLIVLKVLDEIIDFKISNKKINKSIVVLLIICIIMLSSYAFVEYDYSYELVIYIILLYCVEKIYKEKKIKFS